jgi:hypothetical protein
LLRRLEVQRDLREQFLKVCRAQDKPAAQVLREFMREYVAEHGATPQFEAIEDGALRKTERKPTK